MRSLLASSLTARTLLVSALFALLLMAAFGLLVAAIGSQRDAGRLALRSQRAITAGTQLERTTISLDNGVRGYAATQRESALRPFEQGQRLYPVEVRALSRLVGHDPTQQRLVRRIDASIQDYVGLWALPLISLARQQPQIARQQLLNTNGRLRIGTIRSEFRALFARARAVAGNRVARAESRSNLATALGVVGIGLVIALAMGAALFLRRSVIAPVRRVAGATAAVAAGDLTARVPERRADELGALARSFNAMTRALEDRTQQLADRTDELERSNRDLADYASVASHDLQGPLVTISMYGDLLRQRLEAAGSSDAELAESVSDAASRLRGLVRDLLSYSRAGQDELRLETVELDAVLDDVLHDLAGPIAERDADVERDPLPAVHGDRQRLRQVLQNLIANAIKFSGQGARVEVRAAREGDGWRLTVRDHGMGFDPARVSDIFRPFSRLREASRHEGSGIGLAICDRIVRRHGGRIWAESVPGEGSWFHFTLPRAHAAGPVPAADLVAAKAPTATP